MNLSKREAPVKSFKSQRICSISGATDPFTAKLTGRAWLLYAYNTYIHYSGGRLRGSLTQPIIADQLGVSVRTVQRAERELDDKGCDRHDTEDYPAVVSPKKLGELYYVCSYSIPVLWAIHRYNQRGRFNLPLETLASRAGCCAKTVAKALRSLVFHKLVDRRNRFYKASRLQVKGTLMAKKQRKERITRPEGGERRDAEHDSSFRLSCTSTYNSTSYSSKKKTPSARARSSREDLSSVPPERRADVVVQPHTTFKQLLRSPNGIEKADRASPGSSRFDHLRRPYDPFLYKKIFSDEFVQKLNEDYDYMEKYRRRYWMRILGSDKEAAVAKYRDGKTVRVVKGTKAYPHDIEVTEELHQLAGKVHQTWLNLIKSRFSFFYQGNSSITPGQANYAHFVRTANTLVEMRAVRFCRRYLMAQFDEFQYLKENGNVPKRALPLPTYLYGENAEIRWMRYIQEKLEESSRMICKDERIAGLLWKLGEMQRHFVREYQKPMPPEQLIKSRDFERYFANNSGRKTLLKFFALDEL